MSLILEAVKKVKCQHENNSALGSAIRPADGTWFNNPNSRLQEADEPREVNKTRDVLYV